MKKKHFSKAVYFRANDLIAVFIFTLHKSYKIPRNPMNSVQFQHWSITAAKNVNSLPNISSKKRIFAKKETFIFPTIKVVFLNSSDLLEISWGIRA